MYFFNISPQATLPGFKCAFNLSSPCMSRGIEIQCIKESHRYEMLRYLKFLAEWCKLKIMVYNEYFMRLSLLGTEEQLIALVSEFLSDFENPNSPIFYLFENKWYCFEAANNKIEYPTEDTFMTF